MNTKKCKSCGEEIAKGAKVCPNCGAKQKKSIFKKWWFWIIVAVIAIAAISSGGNNENPRIVDSNSQETTQTETETIYKVGDTLATNKFEIKITDVKTATHVGGEYFNTEPSDGGIYVIVEWECKNISDSPVSAFGCPSIKLVDKNNVKYDSDINATSYYATEVNLDRKILSDLNPGINVKDAQVFEISEDAYNAGGFSVLVDADQDFSIEIN